MRSTVKTCQNISKLITGHFVYEEAFSSKKDSWDFFKSSIKEESIAYSKTKRKQMHHERTVLTKQLIRARQALTHGNQSAAKTIQMLENHLKALARREIEGVKIRSRAKWIEGEKPTRFFFRQEQNRIEKNQINSIFDKNNKELPKRIWKKPTLTFILIYIPKNTLIQTSNHLFCPKFPLL